MIKTLRSPSLFTLLFTLSANPAFSATALPEIINQPYDKARKVLVSSGWSPAEAMKLGPNDYYAHDLKEQGFQEVEKCGGSGLIPCSFLFIDSNRQLLRVVTLGEGMPPVKYMQRVTPGVDDGGQEARALAYGEFQKEIENPEAMRSLSSQVIGIDIPALDRAVENLVKLYGISMSERVSEAEKNYIPSKSRVVVTAPYPVASETALEYCQKQKEEAENYWKSSLVAKKANSYLRQAGIVLSGAELYEEMVELRAEKEAKGETIPEVSENDLAISRIMFVSSHDLGLSEKQFMDFSVNSCQLAFHNSFPGIEINSKTQKKTSTENGHYVRRVLTKSNNGQNHKTQAIRIDYLNGVELVAITDRMINHYLASGNYAGAIRELKSQTAAMEKNGLTATVLYGNQVNKLAAACMLNYSDKSGDAKKILEDSIIRMSSAFDKNLGILDREENWVVEDAAELLETIYLANGDRENATKAREVVELIRGQRK